MTLHVQGLGDWTKKLIASVHDLQTKYVSEHRGMSNTLTMLRLADTSFHGPEQVGGGGVGWWSLLVVVCFCSLLLFLFFNTFQIPYFPIQIAGPFGAPTEAWQNFEVVLLVGAGIGAKSERRTTFHPSLHHVCHMPLLRRLARHL